LYQSRSWQEIHPNWVLGGDSTFKNNYLFIFGGRVLLCSLGWPQTHYVTQAGLDLMILLYQHPESWNYRHIPPYLAFGGKFIKEILYKDVDRILGATGVSKIRSHFCM
jgi:hypothetical protein